MTAPTTAPKPWQITRDPVDGRWVVLSSADRPVAWFLGEGDARLWADIAGPRPTDDTPGGAP